ncbi:MAG: DUF47 family protein [PVC group bacterium]
MFSKLMPKEGRFFEYFEAAADKIIEGCRIFEEMLGRYVQTEYRDVCVQEIVKLEHDCDGITHSVIDLINRVFITPIDREDIELLIRTMDSVMDSLQDISQMMVTYEIDRVPPGLAGMARVLSQAMGEVKPALRVLRSMKESGDAVRHCVEIYRLEDEHDDLVRDEIARLFRERKDDPLQVIKLKDVYETIENALDCCEDIANVIQSITIKYT